MRIKIYLIITIINLLNIGYLKGQTESVRDKYSKYKLIYRHHLLYKIKEKFTIRNHKNREIWLVSWKSGEVKLINGKTDKNGAIIISDELTFRYDTLYRIYEGELYSTWSNHEVKNYIGMKYHETDTVPYKCYFYDCLNYPHSEEIFDNCDHRIWMQDIIEHELNTRRNNYEKGRSIIKYQPVNHCEDAFDKDSKLYKFLYPD